MRLRRSSFAGMFALGVGICASSAHAQNTLDDFIFKTMNLTPARQHSSEFVPGALLEVPLKSKNTKWQVVDYREKEKRGLNNPAIEQLTAGQDPFQVNKPTNFKVGLDSIKQVLGGSSVDVGLAKNHEVTVSEIKEKGYVLAGAADQDELKSGALHDWLLANYFTYPKGNVAYFLIKRVYTAQYAEINVDQGFSVTAAIGGKDTGKCEDVQLPGALANPTVTTDTHGSGTQGSGTQGQGSGTSGSGTQGSGTQGSGTQGANSTIHLGGTFCRPDKEHVRFYASEWAPLALEVELITRRNDTFDVAPGVVVLPLQDDKRTATIANHSF